MRSRSNKITDTVVRISVAPGGDFSYNKFLILSQRPALIHTGRLKWFNQIVTRVAEYLDPKAIEVILFSHFEADECALAMLT